MVEIEQREGNAKPEINNRIIATPNWHEALVRWERRVTYRAAFVSRSSNSSLAPTSSPARSKGWGSSEKAKEFIDKKRL